PQRERFVSFLFRIPGHDQHAVELADRSFRVEMIDDGISSWPQLARVHARICATVRRHRGLGIRLGVGPRADIEFGELLHFRCWEGWRFSLLSRGATRMAGNRSGQGQKSNGKYKDHSRANHGISLFGMLGTEGTSYERISRKRTANWSRRRSS